MDKRLVLAMVISRKELVRAKPHFGDGVGGVKGLTGESPEMRNSEMQFRTNRWSPPVVTSTEYGGRS
jgi:hypothetical protein